MDNLVVDDACVRVINGAVSADQELWNLRFFKLSALGEEFTEFGVRLEDVGNPLGGVESSNLNDVFAARPLELVHLLLDAQAPELAHIELRVPDAEFLVQTIKPIGGSAEESQCLFGDIAWNEAFHRVTDEEIRMLDVIPKVFPYSLLRRTLLVDEVTADLDVRAVDDGEVWAGLLDKRDQSWHLGIIWYKAQINSYVYPKRTYR